MAKLTGVGAPNRHTKGAVGDIYVNEETNELYKCILSYRYNDSYEKEEDVTYCWKDLKTKDGGVRIEAPYLDETFDSDDNLISASAVGYKTIRKYWFDGCTKLESADISDGTTTIGPYAFNGCTNLTVLTLPDTIEAINTYAFYKCSNLAITQLPNSLKIVGGDAFRTCSSLALTSLPEGLITISSYAFTGCPKLTITRIPSRVTTIGTMALSSCSGLTSITFEGTPTSIAGDTFYSCTNLEVINVPWSEGAVEKAPWGATNATINYDYTGE